MRPSPAATIPSPFGKGRPLAKMVPHCPGSKVSEGESQAGDAERPRQLDGLALLLRSEPLEQRDRRGDQTPEGGGIERVRFRALAPGNVAQDQLHPGPVRLLLGSKVEDRLELGDLPLGHDKVWFLAGGRIGLAGKRRRRADHGEGARPRQHCFAHWMFPRFLSFGYVKYRRPPGPTRNDCSLAKEQLNRNVGFCAYCTDGRVMNWAKSCRWTPRAGTPHWLTARLTLTHALKPSRPGHARRA